MIYVSRKNIPIVHVIRLIQRNTKKPGLGAQQVDVTNKHFFRKDIKNAQHNTNRTFAAAYTRFSDLTWTELRRGWNEFLFFSHTLIEPRKKTFWRYHERHSYS